MATAPATPMMEQYNAVKAIHPDKILFFRLGDFYEMFNSDAVEASQLLGLTLTSRSKGDAAVPMAGIPYHAADRYIEQLLAAGRRVVICDQVEDAALAKGLVKRDITRVVTPGTVVEDAFLDARPNNSNAACHCGPDGKAGLAWADLSTGEFLLEDDLRSGGASGSLCSVLLELVPARMCCDGAREAHGFTLVSGPGSAAACRCRCGRAPRR